MASRYVYVRDAPGWPSLSHTHRHYHIVLWKIKVPRHFHVEMQLVVSESHVASRTIFIYFNYFAFRFRWPFFSPCSSKVIYVPRGSLLVRFGCGLPKVSCTRIHHAAYGLDDWPLWFFCFPLTLLFFCSCFALSYMYFLINLVMDIAWNVCRWGGPHYATSMHVKLSNKRAIRSVHQKFPGS